MRLWLDNDRANHSTLIVRIAVEDTVIDKGAGGAENPLFISPGCKFLVLNDLSIAVAECAVVPAFIQVMVVPTFTFISFGVNSNSFIITEGPPGAGDCATERQPLVWRSRVTTSTNNPRNLEGCKMCLLSSGSKCGKIAWKNPCSGVC